MFWSPGKHFECCWIRTPASIVSCLNDSIIIAHVFFGPVKFTVTLFRRPQNHVQIVVQNTLSFGQLKTCQSTCPSFEVSHRSLSLFFQKSHPSSHLFHDTHIFANTSSQTLQVFLSCTCSCPLKFWKSLCTSILSRSLVFKVQSRVHIFHTVPWTVQCRISWTGC